MAVILHFDSVADSAVNERRGLLEQIEGLADTATLVLLPLLLQNLGGARQSLEELAVAGGLLVVA